MSTSQSSLSNLVHVQDATIQCTSIRFQEGQGKGPFPGHLKEYVQNLKRLRIVCKLPNLYPGKAEGSQGGSLHKARGHQPECKRQDPRIDQGQGSQTKILQRILCHVDQYKIIPFPELGQACKAGSLWKTHRGRYKPVHIAKSSQPLVSGLLSRHQLGPIGQASPAAILP